MPEYPRTPFKRVSDIISPKVDGDSLDIPTGRCATLTVAANDSSALSKQHADYVCDGTADEVQIQAAIDALPADGGKVLLMEGKYYLSSEISITKDNVVLIGCGIGTELILSSSMYGIRITTNGHNIVISDLYINGNNESNTTGLYLERCFRSRFTGISVRNCTLNGIQLDFALVNTFINCWLRSNGTDATNAGIVVGCLANESNANIFINCESQNNKTGIIVKRGSSNAFQSCVIEGNEYNGIDLITPGSSIYPAETKIKNCWFELNNTSTSANKYDINVSGSSGYTSVTDCHFSGSNVEYAIYTHGDAWYFLLENCRTYNKDFYILGAYSSVFGDVLESTSTISGTYMVCRTSKGICKDGKSLELVRKRNGSGGTITKGEVVEWNSYTDYRTINVCNTRNNPEAIGIMYENTINAAYGMVIIEGLMEDVNANGDIPIITGDLLTTYSGGRLMKARPGDIVFAIAFSALATGNGTIDCVLIPPRTNPGTITHSDLLMDVLAVSATHVRSNEDLSVATPITFTLDAQPDVPRTLSWSFDTHAQITEYDMEVIGIDAKGNSVTETWDETAGWSGETNNAFATITSIKMTSRTGTGASDTMDIGITDVLGLSNTIYETSDVFKIKKNNANATVATAQVNTTYDTYDMSVIGLAATDDFTIWYRSNLNIIS